MILVGRRFALTHFTVLHRFPGKGCNALSSRTCFMNERSEVNKTDETARRR